MRIGWCSTALEAGVCFSPPMKFVPPRDGSEDGRGFLSCPAVRGYFSVTYFIPAPFSLRLAYSEVNGQPIIRPVYPFTSLNENKIRELITIESQSSWRSPSIVALQVPSPYLFFADEPVVMCQDPVTLTTPTSHSWRLIPGKFNIYSWQRPLNWACEWHVEAGDLIIKAGEPLYFITFESAEGQSLGNIELVESPMTPEINEQLRLTRGVASIRRGVMPLFDIAAECRKDKKFVPSEG